jgi:hypothetical protein
MTLVRRNWSWAGILIGLGLVVAGCNRPEIRPRLESPYPYSCRVAVAPFKNLSGSQAVDSIAATDEFVTQLQQVDGLVVLPVNRVLKALNDLGLDGIESPTDAMGLADALSVDVIVAGSINRYEPYQPPLVAMALELYSRREMLRDQQSDRFHVNPADLARAPKLLELDLQESIEPKSSVNRVFDASKMETVERIKRYAMDHSENRTPFGWKIHMTQRRYLRFVSHEMIVELLDMERARLGMN